MNPINSAGTFLIQTVCDLYLLTLLLRFVLQYLRVDYYNPLTQSIVKMTNPVVVPLRRFVPGMWGLDCATLVAIVGITLVKIILLSLIGFHKFPGLIGLLLWAMGDMLTLVIQLFFYSILINIIMSWVAPLSQSPVTPILYRLTDPLLRPVRQMIPTIGGFDISPLPVLIGLKLAIILFASPLTQAGVHLAIR